MKTCLIAINSKYIHENPAVHSLQAYAAAQGIETDVLEFTINQTHEYILGRLFRENADFYAFSVYIWNVSYVYRLIDDLEKVRPYAQIWLGGPEVSCNAEEVLKGHGNITGIMRGEGEETFAELIKTCQLRQPGATQIRDVLGITYREADGETVSTPDRAPMDMDRLPFPYAGREPDNTRIYYYESSRGCPYRCAYCLSSLDKSMRSRRLELVKQELDWFLEKQVPQVKFVDRTFNCDRSRARELWSYIKARDNGVTNFHFEIAADLLTEEDLALLATLRPGQIQLEIGVQTTNPDTLAAICRTASWNKLASNVRRLLIPHNIHIHLDLIAGLPCEDMASFKRSFNDVYGLRPLQLQLGFLKVLKGTGMQAAADSGKVDGYAYSGNPPYEILATPWMSYEELRGLKAIAEMLEVYYNSRQYERTIAKLEEYFTDPFTMYQQLACFFESHRYDEIKHARMRLYEILLEFIRSCGIDESPLIPLLLSDAYARERLKHFPEWGRGYEGPQEFDYEDRDPLTNNAKKLQNKE